jgi:predicted RNase H-like nuclease (RuvC/YqgF family)
MDEILSLHDNVMDYDTYKETRDELADARHALHDKTLTPQEIKYHEDIIVDLETDLDKHHNAVKILTEKGVING